MYDTIRLRSPEISDQAARAVSQFLTRRTAVKMDTGEVLYEFTSESLRGSYDARVMVQVKREEWFKGPESKIPVKLPCRPYLVVEASIHKQLMGHNVYGGPTSFQAAALWFVAFLSRQMAQDLPPAASWWVERVDLAECYEIGQEACEEYMASLKPVRYARRQVDTHGDTGIYSAGVTTTVKMYLKGPELQKHDYKRLRAWLSPEDLEGLQARANGIIRVETEIKTRKLQAVYEEPTVARVQDEDLEKIHDREVARLLKEGQSDMETVRTTTQVKRRLFEWYSGPQAGALYSTWLSLATVGEKETRRDMPRRTWFHHKKLLLEAGCAWTGTDVLIFQTLIPEGFSPVRKDPRRLIEEAYEVSAQLEPFRVTSDNHTYR